MALALVAAFGATTVHAAPAADVPARVKALNELLAEQWEYQLKESPEFATILGDYRYNDRFSDLSIAHTLQQKRTRRRSWRASRRSTRAASTSRTGSTSS